MNRTVCVKDFEDFAKQNLPKNAFDYYQSGADDEYSLQDNVLSFKRQAVAKAWSPPETFQGASRSMFDFQWVKTAIL